MREMIKMVVVLVDPEPLFPAGLLAAVIKDGTKLTRSNCRQLTFVKGPAIQKYPGGRRPMIPLWTVSKLNTRDQERPAFFVGVFDGEPSNAVAFETCR
jgi:hypothetical protein